MHIQSLKCKIYGLGVLALKAPLLIARVVNGHFASLRTSSSGK